MHITAKEYIFVLTVTVACMVMSGATQAQERYHNEEYSFSVNLPHGLRMCRSLPPNPDHGVVVPLDPHVDCDALTAETVRNIYVSGEFNAIEASDLDHLMSVYCANQGIRPAALSKLSIPNERTKSCEVNAPGGVMDIWVFAQEKGGNFVDSWVDYEILLKTTPKYLSHDLNTFQQVLRGIKIGNDRNQGRR
jgi:hypothetical protein